MDLYLTREVGPLRLPMLLGLAVLCTLGAVSCGSGAVTPPDSTANSPGASVPRETSKSSETEQSNRYKWELPPNDTSPSVNEATFYNELRVCQGAEEELQEEQWWQGFASPRNVLLYMAAAHVCHGDSAGGRPFYNRAVNEFGLSGLGEGSKPCDVYRSLSSVLLQAPRRSFRCPGGDAPRFKGWQSGEKDNPLTFGIDESQPSTPSAPPSDQSSSPPSDQSSAATSSP